MSELQSVGWILVLILFGIGVILRALGADKPRRRLRVVDDEDARNQWLEDMSRRGGP